MRPLLILSAKILAAPVLAALLYAAAASVLGRIVRPAQTAATADSVAVYLVSNGVHTDLVLPLDPVLFDWSALIRPQHTRSASADARYAAFGWGDRGFFLETPTWSELRSGTALRAVSGTGGTAMHVLFLDEAPAGGNSIRISTSVGQYRRLAAAVSRSFRTENGRSLPIAGAGYGGNDAFYEAVGRYSPFFTCNTWTNKRLHEAGLKSVLWTPFAEPLMTAYRDN